MVCAPSQPAFLTRRTRFEREAQAVAALNHPNIVTIHSVEEAGDVMFLTMEAVEGRTLKDLTDAGALPIDMVLRVAVAMSDALAPGRHFSCL